MKILFLIFLTTLLGTISAQTDSFPGVLFNSKNVARLNRTSFLLNEGKPITIDGDFQISFDISFHKTRYFGHILRIYNKQGTDFRLIFNQFEKKDTFSLHLFKDEKLLIDIPFEHKELIRNNWINIKLRFNVKENKIILRAADSSGEADLNLKKDSFIFCFGIRDFNNYTDYDIPGIAVKNISIRYGSKQKYLWKLNPGSGEGLTDEISGSKIAGKNINWLADSHYRWNEIKEINSPLPPMFAFDSVNARLFIDRKYSLLIYDLKDESERTIGYKNERPGKYHQLLYDTETNRLFSTFVSQGEVSEFNFETRYWQSIDTSDENEGRYYGCRKFISDSNIFMFGGYGWYTAKDSLMRYDFRSKSWDRISIADTTLTPRFDFAIGEGLHPGEFLLFGGVGNKSGKQEHEFRPYYDLHRLNMDEQRSKLIWNPDNCSIPYMYLSENLYLNKADSSFYIMRRYIDSARTYCDILKGSIPGKSFVNLGKRIEMGSDSLMPNYNFYLSRKTNEFILATYSNADQKIKIYSLLYPPAAGPAEITTAGNNRAYLFIIPAALIILMGTFLLIRKRRGKKATLWSGHSGSHQGTGPGKNFLQVFGGFHLYDAEGRDLSIEFSSKLKELFLLILTSNLRNYNNGGISSDELTGILWPDASPRNSKSNRGVAISKIRNIIKSAPIRLEFMEKSWHLIFDDENFRSDYSEYKKLKEFGEGKTELEKEEVDEILDLISHGDYLRGLSYGWLDAYKVSIDEEMIKVLLSLAELPPIRDDKEILLKIVNAVLKIDLVEEKAFKLKLKILTEEGKISQAKSNYDLFVAEYKRLYDEEYAESFQKLISE